LYAIRIRISIWNEEKIVNWKGADVEGDRGCTLNPKP
jgi:hypothetical protein